MSGRGSSALAAATAVILRKPGAASWRDGRRPDGFAYGVDALTEDSSDDEWLEASDSLVEQQPYGRFSRANPVLSSEIAIFRPSGIACRVHVGFGPASGPHAFDSFSVETRSRQELLAPTDPLLLEGDYLYFGTRLDDALDAANKKLVDLMRDSGLQTPLFDRATFLRALKAHPRR